MTKCQRKALGCIARKKSAPDPEQMRISVHAHPPLLFPLSCSHLKKGANQASL